MSRRQCLSWLARAAALGFAAQCGLRASAGEKSDGFVKIADLVSLRNESALEIAKPELIAVRGKKGVACLAAYCTHRHNKLSVDGAGGIFCPAHHSIFDLTGKPVSGPASRPLSWYQTRVDDDGAIFCNASKTVKQGEWAALPAWAKPKNAE